MINTRMAADQTSLIQLSKISSAGMLENVAVAILLSYLSVMIIDVEHVSTEKENQKYSCL